LLPLAFPHFSEETAGGLLLADVAVEVVFGAERVIAQLLREPLGEVSKVDVPCQFQLRSVVRALFRLPVLHFLKAAVTLGFPFLDKFWIPPALEPADDLVNAGGRCVLPREAGALGVLHGVAVGELFCHFTVEDVAGVVVFGLLPLAYVIRLAGLTVGDGFLNGLDFLR
jgi:hypothetical protein